MVAAGFVYRGDCVLLARRASTKRIAPGVYHLPGGHVEAGETPAEALRREILEEFRAHVAVGEPIGTFEYVSGGSTTAGIAFLVEGNHLERELWFNPDDTASLVWAEESALVHYLHPADHNLMLARKGFDQLRRKGLNATQ